MPSSSPAESWLITWGVAMLRLAARDCHCCLPRWGSSASQASRSAYTPRLTATHAPVRTNPSTWSGATPAASACRRVISPWFAASAAYTSGVIRSGFAAPQSSAAPCRPPVENPPRRPACGRIRGPPLPLVTLSYRV